MDSIQRQAAPKEPAARRWPFVTIIVCDMLLLLLLGFLAYMDLSERMDRVNKIMTVELVILKDRVAQLESAQQFDQMAPSRNKPIQGRTAPRR
jgi:hypothetical protein